MKKYQCDVLIVGGGIAGLVTAYELLKKEKSIIIFDKDIRENLGGLAKEAAGGIHLIGSPEQTKSGIKDSPEIGFKDWLGMAKFSEKDIWPKKWAELYCFHSIDYIYSYIREIGLSFIRTPLWIERGLFTSANSLPRFHVLMGTGYGLVINTIEAMNNLSQRNNLQIYYEHEVNDVEQGKSYATIRGKNMKTNEEFEAVGHQVIIASGGISGGDLSELKKHWPGDGRKAPEYMLNGAHKYGDGLLHHNIESKGGVLTNLNNNWIYAVGVHHPDKRKPFDGISLQPGISCLWFNAIGERIGPIPLFLQSGTKRVVDRILDQPGKYSWVIMNWKIAKRELIVSLSRYFAAIREKRKLLLLKNTLFGDEARINLLTKEAPDDVLLANNLDELLLKMQAKSLFEIEIDKENIREEIKNYDDQIDRGPSFHNDEQLRRLSNYRTYLPDRLRLCKFQKIIDPKAGPLIAIRSFLISRKSLGGIQTDLNCRVLKKDGRPFGNIYAVGEAAGYGGGGIHGQNSPEGTFLGGCILTARVCAESID
jgi:hypothetical protein